METLTTNTLTFNDMIRLEPRLAVLKEKCFVIWQAMSFSRRELERRMVFRNQTDNDEMRRIRRGSPGTSNLRGLRLLLSISF